MMREQIKEPKDYRAEKPYEQQVEHVRGDEHGRQSDSDDDRQRCSRSTLHDARSVQQELLRVGGSFYIEPSHV